MNANPHDWNSREIDEATLTAYALGQLGQQEQAQAWSRRHRQRGTDGQRAVGFDTRQRRVESLHGEHGVFPCGIAPNCVVDDEVVPGVRPLEVGARLLGHAADTGQVQPARKPRRPTAPVAMEIKLVALEALEGGADKKDVAQVVGVGPHNRISEVVFGGNDTN